MHIVVVLMKETILKTINSIRVQTITNNQLFPFTTLRISTEGTSR